MVSEDQPMFEPPYAAAPVMHMKAEMTPPPGGFGQTSKPSPEPSDSEWGGKRGEHVNGTR